MLSSNYNAYIVQTTVVISNQIMYTLFIPAGNLKATGIDHVAISFCQLLISVLFFRNCVYVVKNGSNTFSGNTRLSSVQGLLCTYMD